MGSRGPYPIPGSGAAAAAAKSLQSCLTLCDPIDGSPPGSAIPGILQARTLESVAISFSDPRLGGRIRAPNGTPRNSAPLWSLESRADEALPAPRQEGREGSPPRLPGLRPGTP